MFASLNISNTELEGDPIVDIRRVIPCVRCCGISSVVLLTMSTLCAQESSKDLDAAIQQLSASRPVIAHASVQRSPIKATQNHQVMTRGMQASFKLIAMVSDISFHHVILGRGLTKCWPPRSEKSASSCPTTHTVTKELSCGS